MCIRDRVNFCPHCGAPLARPGAAFCVTCGRSLQARQTTGSTSAAPQLRIQLPGHPEETFVITQPRVTIGRDPTNDLVLDSPIVSRRHAELELRADAVWWRDLGSANGTAVNGRLITEQALGDGDIVRIGDAQGNSVGLVFHRPSAGPSTGTIQLGRKELGQAAVFIIGRDPSVNLPLDHPTVSRLHAEVRLSPSGPVLRDLGSSNGTFLNGELLTGPRPLAPRDVVQIGPYKLVYDQAGFAQYTPDGNYRIDALHLERRGFIGGGGLRVGGGAGARGGNPRAARPSGVPPAGGGPGRGARAGESALREPRGAVVPPRRRRVVHSRLSVPRDPCIPRSLTILGGSATFKPEGQTLPDEPAALAYLAAIVAQVIAAPTPGRLAQAAGAAQDRSDEGGTLDAQPSV